ncbi:MAG: M20/M25/M40 family metallo-hydrolase [Proteobacteria bacterium]|nr:MAG: M20/M25/M40 family metallo-hydrolase [Pseudomonadota bacterium]
MNHQRTQAFVDALWRDSILPTIVEYIRIPAKSPLFDAAWETHGYIDDAVTLMRDWYAQHAIDGAGMEVVRLPGRTPTLFIDVPGSLDHTILLYGHLDKQPEMSGWRDGLGPWTPVLEGDRLYGRGGADDGYALFSSVAAVLALKDQGLPHAGLKILIEASEESGSPDLPAYMEALADRIGQPDLVVCLDSGCGNYDQLWLTTSLRGLVGGRLTVEVLEEGVHSGDAGGVVPSSFRICRRLLGRLEDDADGSVLPADFHCDIPSERVEQARHAAGVMGADAFRRFPFAGRTRQVDDDTAASILNRTWRPALEVTGAAGLPSLESAGNTLRPGTALKLSLRLPPLVSGMRAAEALKALLEAEPPHGASVRFDPEQAATGWNAPPTRAWLDASINGASEAFFGRPAVNMGEGGTIPFMAMLGEQYPNAQFVITGVLGPKSNAHGPNEFLHVPMARRLTACVARVIHDHYVEFAGREAAC